MFKKVVTVKTAKAVIAHAKITTFFLRFYGTDPKLIDACLTQMRDLGYHFIDTRCPLTQSMNLITPANSTEVTLTFKTKKDRSRFIADKRTKAVYEASGPGGKVTLRLPGDMAYVQKS